VGRPPTRQRNGTLQYPTDRLAWRAGWSVPGSGSRAAIALSAPLTRVPQDPQPLMRRDEAVHIPSAIAIGRQRLLQNAFPAYSAISG